MRNHSRSSDFTEIHQTNRSLRRVIKLLVFSICTTGFFYQTWSFLDMYLRYPTILDINVEYPETFNGPAITICNRNRILRQPYCKKYPEKCDWQYDTWEKFCEKYKRQCPAERPSDFIFGIPNTPDAGWFSILNNSNEVLNALGPQEDSKFILSCVIKDLPFLRMCKSQTMIQIAHGGFPFKCFSLLSLLGEPNEELHKVSLTTEYNIMLNMQPEEYINNNHLVQATAFLHDPRKLANPMTEGVILSAGKLYKLSVTMEKSENLPPPYSTRCRKYLEEWKINGGYGPLTKRDCTDLCKMKAMVDEYGCVGRAITYPNNYSICDNTSIITSSKVNERCSNICRDACEENVYLFTAEIVDDFQYMCPQGDELCKYQILAITVSFSQMRVQKFQQIPRFESIALFSYIGGYLGMWLGISLASMFDVAEMIHDVIAYLILRRKKNRKTPIEQFRHHTV